jgi:hypothetical protein
MECSPQEIIFLAIKPFLKIERMQGTVLGSNEIKTGSNNERLSGKPKIFEEYINCF